MQSRWSSTQAECLTGSPEILIVEDEKIARRALAMLLGACGYQAMAFESAEDALRWLETGRHPRAALVDLDLPGMNGLELIERLRDLTPGTFPLLVTATDEETLATRLNRRSICFLRKPVDLDVLLRTLAARAHSN